jgi:hypothetical protein
MTHYLKRFNTFDLIFLVLNATFSNISAISWRPVLVVEEAETDNETEAGNGMERNVQNGQISSKIL